MQGKRASSTFARGRRLHGCRGLRRQREGPAFSRSELQSALARRGVARNSRQFVICLTGARLWRSQGRWVSGRGAPPASDLGLREPTGSLPTLGPKPVVLRCQRIAKRAGARRGPQLDGRWVCQTPAATARSAKRSPRVGGFGAGSASGAIDPPSDRLPWPVLERAVAKFVVIVTSTGTPTLTWVWITKSRSCDPR